MAFNCQRIFFVCDQAPGLKMIIITAAGSYIYYFQFKYTLEHCQESGEERGERLAPGDQGDPQRGKEGKYMMR